MSKVKIGGLLWLASTTSAYRAHAAPPVNVALGFAGYASDASLALGAREAAVNHVEQAWLSVERLRFHEAGRRDDPAGRSDLAGPVFVELVGGRAVGGRDALRLEVRRYAGVDGAFHVVEREGESPRDMGGASILVLGRRADGVRFVIRSQRADSMDLRATAPRGFAVREADVGLFVGIDLSAWLRGVDLRAAEVDHAGDTPLIRIDERSNTEMLQVFERNVPAGIALFRDEDADGVLSIREHASDKPLASGREARRPVLVRR